MTCPDPTTPVNGYIEVSGYSGQYEYGRSVIIFVLNKCRYKISIFLSVLRPTTATPASASRTAGPASAAASCAGPRVSGSRRWPRPRARVSA